MPQQHTDKEKRQASHVKASEKKAGHSEKEAEHIAWATVNKGKSDGRTHKK